VILPASPRVQAVSPPQADLQFDAGRSVVQAWTQHCPPVVRPGVRIKPPAAARGSPIPAEPDNATPTVIAPPLVAPLELDTAPECDVQRAAARSATSSVEINTAPECDVQRAAARSATSILQSGVSLHRCEIANAQPPAAPVPDPQAEATAAVRAVAVRFDQPFGKRTTLR
jgi:hypothetical protein